jgi:type II secretory pathway pseudopilin PulG
MAVVVVIVGVIIAGVFTGQNIYKAAELRRLSTEIMQYTTAIEQFKQEYQYYPGDFLDSDSQAFWGAGVSGGNGDGTIRFQFAPASGSEDLYAWEHLASSEIIPGAYDGNTTSSTAPKVHYTSGVNAPASNAFDNITFAFYSYRPAGGNYIYDSITGVKLVVSSLDSSGVPGGTTGSLIARQAHAIDEKIDDGVPSSGRLISYRSAGGCTDADEDSALSANYQLSDTTGDCVVEWYLDKY